MEEMFDQYIQACSEAIDWGVRARDLWGLVEPVPNEATSAWREAGTRCLTALGLSTQLAAKNHELVSQMTEI